MDWMADKEVQMADQSWTAVGFRKAEEGQGGALADLNLTDDPLENCFLNLEYFGS
jgi:hypothetical protein